MNAIKKEILDSNKKMPLLDFIDLIKEKYPTPEGRLSFVDCMPLRDENGKIDIAKVQKKALWMQILFIEFN